MVDTLYFRGTSIVHIILTGVDNIQEKILPSTQVLARNKHAMSLHIYILRGSDQALKALYWLMTAQCSVSLHICIKGFG